MLITNSPLYCSIFRLIDEHLTARQSLAPNDPELKTAPGNQQPGYVVAMLDAIRKEIENAAGVEPDLREMQRIELTAMGHVDYQPKLALRLTQYAYDMK